MYAQSLQHVQCPVMLCTPLLVLSSVRDALSQELPDLASAAGVLLYGADDTVLRRMFSISWRRINSSKIPSRNLKSIFSKHPVHLYHKTHQPPPQKSIMTMDRRLKIGVVGLGRMVRVFTHLPRLLV